MRGNYPQSSKKKLIFGLVVILFAATVWLTIIRAQRGLNEVLVPNRPSEKIKDITLADHFKHQTPINILLLGYAGGNHEGTYLTDSMIVVQINLKKSQSHLVSLPRDIWINLPTDQNGGNHHKINAAYAVGLDDRNFKNKPPQYQGPGGGGAMVKQAVERVTGLPIDRFVAVDFTGFEKAIDLLGGVDVTVDKTFDDPEYPIAGAEEDLCGKTPEDLPELLKIATVSAVQAFPCRFETLHFEQGINHLDGATALKFVRSRHSGQDGSDFARSNRQRNLLLAVKERVLSLNFIPKILPTLEILKDHFRTDFSLDDLKTLTDKYSELKDYSVKNLALTTENALKESFSDDGQYILVPNNGAVDNWNLVQRYLNERLNLDQKITTPVIKVENAAGQAGLADRVSQTLKAEGFIVTKPLTNNGRKRAQTTITLYSDRIDSEVLEKISTEVGSASSGKKEFLVMEVTNSPTEKPYDILISLGRDYHPEKNP